MHNHGLKAMLAGLLLVTTGCSAKQTAVSSVKEPVKENTEEPEEEKEEVVTETLAGGGPFAEHGALHVEGSNLVDQNGEAYQLYGMSTHGIAWFPEYINADTFHTLKEEWNTNCVRLAMYTAEYGGYCTDGNQEQLKNLIEQGIAYAKDEGMYVIVDWHVLNDQNPMQYAAQAEQFFSEISEKYKDEDHIIYEICNEPNSSANWLDITNYANRIIPVIRNNDSNAVIIVGTPNWSQDIEEPLKQPLPYDNLFYALHFYAGTHKEWLRQRAESCIRQGLPVLISEFGLCDASGNGNIDTYEAEEWKKLINQYNLSYLCWNLANKDESSSILNTNCSKVSNWDDSDLKEQGKIVKNWFEKELE